MKEIKDNDQYPEFKDLNDVQKEVLKGTLFYDAWLLANACKGLKKAIINLFP